MRGATDRRAEDGIVAGGNLTALGMAGLAAAVAFLFLAPAGAGTAQQGSQKATLAGSTAGDYYENVQALKDIPASELIPAMRYITTSLGVGCDFCHDERHFESDDKKEKKIARKMMEMMFAIDQNSFGGKRIVTCYTCHRGSTKPITTPMLPGQIAEASGSEGTGGAGGEKNATATAANLPKAEEIVAKYVEAIGGEKAIAGVGTLVEKGTYTMAGRGVAAQVEIARKAPDLSVTTIVTPHGGMAHGFDGAGGWARFGDHVEGVAGNDLVQEKRWGAIYPGADIASYYKRLQTAGTEKIDGQDAYRVTGWPATGAPEQMYFDEKTGLLVRVTSLADSPLGALPKEVDYGDFREAGGIKVPATIRIVQLSGTGTYQFASIQANATVDDARFAAPKEKAQEK